MLAVIIHSIAELYLHNNSLTGTIPSEIALLSNLCESSVVGFLAMTIVVVIFFSVLSCLSSLFILHSWVVSLEQ